MTDWGEGQDDNMGWRTFWGRVEMTIIFILSHPILTSLRDTPGMSRNDRNGPALPPTLKYFNGHKPNRDSFQSDQNHDQSAEDESHAPCKKWQ